MPIPAQFRESVSETTALLTPSGCSTEQSSRENLIGLLDEEETLKLTRNGSEIQLQSFGHLAGDDDYYDDLGKRKRRRFPGLFCVAGVVVLSALVVVLCKRSSTSESLPTRFQARRPLSTLDPVKDLGLAAFRRPEESSPPKTLTKILSAEAPSTQFPTNAWYQNLLLVEDEPTQANRAYSIPYVIDATGPIPGLRVLPNHVGATQDVVQIYVVEEYGLTLGASIDEKEKEPSKRYNVVKTTDLGLTVQWEHFPMVSTIVKGMPYTTMTYEKPQTSSSRRKVLPTISSQIGLAADPIVDEKHSIDCSDGKSFTVNREIELFFDESDFTWLAFFSEPVRVQCVVDKNTNELQLQVVSYLDKSKNEDPLTIRVAMYKTCTSDQSPIYCHQEQMHPTALHLGQGSYGRILREHAHLYPGPDNGFDFVVNEKTGEIRHLFDWDVRDMTPGTRSNTSATQLIAFALPHHFDMFEQNPFDWTNEIYCAASLVGPSCLVEGSTWTLIDHVPDIDFRAPRSPESWALDALSKSLRQDLRFTLPHYFQLGAGDTYFSGKQLAKLGRVLLITEELKEMCHYGSNESICDEGMLPSDDDVNAAIASLRSSVQVWLDGTAITPFVYDSAWGGVASCGCHFDSKKKTCFNRFPECPAFSETGLNFGNAFYNDMHFHYGYHIYAAAVVSHFDADWGKRFFERVLLLIRTIANPSVDDKYFPTWRHKDWYNGHSWASGIAGPPYLNGKNQESSSEAIAAYEGIALYGKAMARVWEASGRHSELRAAKDVMAVGQVLTASELRSAKAYWHVSHSPDRAMKMFPSSYTPNVVGIMWQMMAQFQTWFGRSPYLMYGIQQLPLTPISEARDGASWVREMYPSFAESCEMDPGCTETGWSVLLAGALATAGHPRLALERTLQMTPDHFDGPAGDGHSLSNTIWYIATRPHVDDPVVLRSNSSTTDTDYGFLTPGERSVVRHCGKPTKCTDYVLDTIAGLYSCRQRIQWLMDQRGKSESEACSTVAGTEHTRQCGQCDPGDVSTAEKEITPSQCPPCTVEECSSDLNRCPRFERTFVCSGGANIGGCSDFSWVLDDTSCSSCCELTNCPSKPEVSRESPPEAEGEDADCPPCSSDVCKSRINQCPSGGSAPYLCYDGSSVGGCSPKPWFLKGGPCKKCCNVYTGCN